MKKEQVKLITKEAYLQRMLDKQPDQFIVSIAKEAMTETNDAFIEGLVYRGTPSLAG